MPTCNQIFVSVIDIVSYDCIIIVLYFIRIKMLKYDITLLLADQLNKSNRFH